MSSAIRRSDIVTSAVRTPASRRLRSISRAPGRNGTPSAAAASRTRSVSSSTISSAPMPHAGALEDHGAVDEAAADELQGLLVGPGAAEARRRARSRRPSSTARCRRGCRPCPRGPRAGCCVTAPCYRGPVGPPAVPVPPTGASLDGTRGDRRALRGMFVQVLGSRIVVAAFDGWNDAGEAASAAAGQIGDSGPYDLVHAVDPELYFDYQWARPTLRAGRPTGRAACAGPERGCCARSAPRRSRGSGCSPARSPHARGRRSAPSSSTLRCARTSTGFVTLGAMLSDVPHTRPISIFASSENADVRDALGIERSTYEGPIGILSALEHAAEQAGIPAAVALGVRAALRADRRSSPEGHARADRPAATRSLESTSRAASSPTEAAAWEATIDAARRRGRGDGRLHRAARGQARTPVDSPEASGEAIAQEFERYLRRRETASGRPASTSAESCALGLSAGRCRDRRPSRAARSARCRAGSGTSTNGRKLRREIQPMKNAITARPTTNATRWPRAVSPARTPRRAVPALREPACTAP